MIEHFCMASPILQIGLAENGFILSSNGFVPTRVFTSEVAAIRAIREAFRAFAELRKAHALAVKEADAIGPGVEIEIARPTSAGEQAGDQYVKAVASAAGISEQLAREKIREQLGIEDWRDGAPEREDGES